MSAYIVVLPDVVSALYADGDVDVDAAAIISLVDRPELGGWLARAMGTAYVLPEHTPRSGRQTVVSLSHDRAPRCHL